jgi:hypothetical protein
MSGASCAESYGFQTAFQVHTRSFIPFEVRKRITVNGRLINPYPASAVASAHSELLGLANMRGEECKLSVLFARARASQDKPTAEMIVADRARVRLAREFDDEVYAQLAERHDTLAQGLDFARALNMTPRPFEWSTSAEQVHLKITVPAPGQSSASPPPAVARSTDLAFAVHQSLLNELASQTIAGQTFSFDQMADVIRNVIPLFLGNDQLYDDVSAVKRKVKALQKTGVNPLMIEFAQRRPLTVTFADQGFTLGIHAARFKEGGTTFPAVDLRAAYRIEKTSTGFVAVRKGEVQVLSSAASMKVDPRLRSRLGTSYNLLFVDRIAVTAMPLPTVLGAESTRTGRLVPVQLAARDGWLQFSWVWKEK